MKTNACEKKSFQKTKRAFLFSILCFASSVYAQTAAFSKIKDDVKIVNDPLANMVNIRFSSEKEIYNLLIMITDSLGQTIFLDSRYRFHGNYNYNVDFRDYKKGQYTVKIIGDDNTITKKIDIR